MSQVFLLGPATSLKPETPFARFLAPLGMALFKIRVHPCRSVALFPECLCFLRVLCGVHFAYGSIKMKYDDAQKLVGMLPRGRAVKIML